MNENNNEWNKGKKSKAKWVRGYAMNCIHVIEIADRRSLDNEIIKSSEHKIWD